MWVAGKSADLFPPWESFYFFHQDGSFLLDFFIFQHSSSIRGVWFCSSRQVSLFFGTCSALSPVSSHSPKAILQDWTRGERGRDWCASRGGPGSTGTLTAPSASPPLWAGVISGDPQGTVLGPFRSSRRTPISDQHTVCLTVLYLTETLQKWIHRLNQECKTQVYETKIKTLTHFDENWSLFIHFPSWSK